MSSSKRRPLHVAIFTDYQSSFALQVVPLARKGKITIDELPLQTDKLSDECYVEFNEQWEKALAAHKGKDGSPSLLKVCE